MMMMMMMLVLLWRGNTAERGTCDIAIDPNIGCECVCGQDPHLATALL